jgi:hypothetical protein
MNTYLMYQDCSCFIVGRYSLFAGVSVHAVRYQSSFILLPRIRHAGAAHIMPAAHLLRGRVLLSCTWLLYLVPRRWGKISEHHLRVGK